MCVFIYFASIGIETTVTITLKKKRELADCIQLFNILFRKRLTKKSDTEIEEFAAFST
jgi:hypothetical protein